MSLGATALVARTLVTAALAGFAVLAGLRFTTFALTALALAADAAKAGIKATSGG
ncbi:MAG: hypothetical protein ABIO68_02400 [Sphingomicrobium sp.]